MKVLIHTMHTSRSVGASLQSCALGNKLKEMGYEPWLLYFTPDGYCASRNPHKDFLPFEAVSSVIINTEKAAALWERIKENFYFRRINIETEIKLNKQLHECTEKPEDRDYICLAMMNGEWDKLKNYTKKPANTSFRTKLLSHMPVSLKKQIYGFMQAVKGKKTSN